MSRTAVHYSWDFCTYLLATEVKNCSDPGARFSRPAAAQEPVGVGTYSMGSEATTTPALLLLHGTGRSHSLAVRIWTGERGNRRELGIWTGIKKTRETGTAGVIS